MHYLCATKNINKMPKTFKTRIKLGASAEDVYSALTNPFALELWTGYPAKMSTEVGSEFELWEGDICGQYLDFYPNKHNLNHPDKHS